MSIIKSALKDNRPYPIVKSETHRIGRFEIILDTINIRGKDYPYSYIREKDCVCVLALYHGKIVLIRQYRHSTDEWLMELPCGQIEDGETPERAASRELLEETGLVARELVFLGKLHMRAGVSTGQAFLYYAGCDVRQETRLDDTELIEVGFYSPDEVDALVDNGGFAQLLGLVCWQRAKDRIGEVSCLLK